MNKQTNFQATIKKHKAGALIMGVCLVLIILLHLWQKGFNSLLPVLEQGMK